MIEVISREEARQAGLRHFFTGVHCKRGHLDNRFVSTGQCTACQRDHRRRWRAANPEKEAESRVKSLRKFATEKPERKKELARRWNAKNSKANVERARKWTAANPERAKELAVNADRNRRALRANAEGKHTVEDVLELLEVQGFRCVYCTASLDEGYHVDHMTPLSRGGSNWPTNLQCLCPPCNLRKATKTHEEYLLILSAANDNEPKKDAP